MWTSIVNGIVSILKSLLSIFEKNKERENKEFDIKNTEEAIKKEEKRQEVTVRDKVEETINTIQHGDEKAKKAALDELRRRVAR